MALSVDLSYLEQHKSFSKKQAESKGSEATVRKCRQNSTDDPMQDWIIILTLLTATLKQLLISLKIYWYYQTDISLQENNKIIYFISLQLLLSDSFTGA